MAFVQLMPLVTMTIIGAKTMAQLTENIESQDVELSKEVLEEIHRVYGDVPDLVV